jgi:hypothetical protein
MESQQVQLGSVTFVLAETIVRELRAKVTHHLVARYLGDYAGSSDAQTNAVAVDDGCLRNRERNNGQSIDQDMLRRIDQSTDREAHRSMAGTQNVDAINLYGIYHANGPSDFGIGHQLRINFLSQFRRKLFGIVQATMAEFFGKNYCSGHDRTRQCSSTSLIDPRNPSQAGGAQFFLVTKSASPVHLCKSLADLRE